MDNPLETNPAREQRIRERAYHLWETEGKPHGRDVEYWQRARALVAMEDSAGAGLLPNPRTEPGSLRDDGAEEAELQDSPREFPDRFADQGEVPPTPAPRRSPARRRKAPVPATKKGKTS